MQRKHPWCHDDELCDITLVLLYIEAWELVTKSYRCYDVFTLNVYYDDIHKVNKVIYKEQSGDNAVIIYFSITSLWHLVKKLMWS